MREPKSGTDAHLYFKSEIKGDSVQSRAPGIAFAMYLPLYCFLAEVEFSSSAVRGMRSAADGLVERFDIEPFSDFSAK